MRGVIAVTGRAKEMTAREVMMVQLFQKVTLTTCTGMAKAAKVLPLPPPQKKSVMSALRPEEIKEKAKEKANLMAKRMKDGVKVAMNKMKMYAKKKQRNLPRAFRSRFCT